MSLAYHADQIRTDGSHLNINEALALLSPAKDLRREHLTDPVGAVLGAREHGRVEWYTPAPYLDCARQVLDKIDLDPASSDIAQEQVRAGSYFTKDHDGLAQEWAGKIFCNPPYCDTDKFVDKLLEELTAGRVIEALLLVNAYTDKRWFHRAAAACAAICFTLGRIRFMTPDGEAQGQPPHGSAIFYFGPRLDRFCDAFAAHGLITSPVRADPP
jgi:hypothetical protein